MTTKPSPGSIGCPAAGELAAYLDGMLPEQGRADVERHLAACADCRDVAAAVAALPALDAADGHAARVNVLVPAAIVTLAAAAVLLLAVVLPGRWAAHERTKLLEAVSAVRTTEARLTTARDYAPPPSVTRTGAPTEDGDGDGGGHVDARIAEAEFDKLAGADPSAANLHALGIARLALGDPRGAVDALDRAAEASPRAGILTDLAAALLESGRRHADDAQIARARSLLARVMEREPSSEPALFNAALAAEYAGDRDEAIAAWTRYLARDVDSPWAAEARTRLDRVRTR